MADQLTPNEPVQPPDDYTTSFTDAANAAGQSAPTQVPSGQPAPAAPQAVSDLAPTPGPGDAPAAPAAAPAPAVPPPSLSAVAAAAREAGLVYQGLSDEDILQAMRDTITRSRPYATYGQQLAPYAEQIAEFFSTQAPQGGQPTGAPGAGTTPTGEEPAWDEAKYFEEKWGSPKWDPTYDFAIRQGLVQRNPNTGVYEASPGCEGMVMEILPGIQRAMAWRAQQWQTITDGNPYRQFYDVMRQPMQKAWQQDIEDAIQRRIDAAQTEDFVTRFEQDNAPWMWTVDPNTGVRVPTPQGQRFFQEVTALEQSGAVQDIPTLLQFALMRVQQSSGAAPAAPAMPAAPALPPQAQNPQAASQSQQTSFLQNALQRASHSPSSGGYVAPAPDNPVTVNETELDNLFVSGFRASRPG